MKNLYILLRWKSLCLLLILFSFKTSSAQIAVWDLTGVSSPATVNATSADLNLSAVPVLSRGSGAAATAASNSFRTTGFQNNGIAVTNTDYFQFSLKAAAGYTLNVTSIDAKFNGTASFVVTPGVTSQYAYSLDNVTYTLIGSAVTTTSLAPPQVDLSGISALQNVPSATTVYIRYYASGQTTTGGWGFSSPSAGSAALSIGGSVISTCVAPAAPSGSVTPSANPACGSTTLSFPASSVSGVVYYWQTSSSGTSITQPTNGTPNYTVNTSGTYYVRAYTTATGCWSLSSVASSAITIYTAPSISMQPVNTSTSTSQTATFSVTASGSGLTYQWQVNTGSGFTNITNGGVYSNATTSTLTITNPSITYNGYQYRVIVSGSSPCAAVTSTSATLSVSLYCVPTTSLSCDEYISTVSVNTLTNNSPSPYSCGITSTGYSDYSSLTTTVVKGQTYSINIGVGEVSTPDPTSGYTNDDIRIWADWNQNGVFTDAGETLTSINNNGGAGAFSFTVPLTATSGNVRLRVRLVYDNETSSCGSATYGETEDYTLIVADPCASGYTVSGFYPTSGPAGTFVRIVGTGFTGVTSVAFNNIAASSFTVVSSTVILARVPSNAGTGKITITNGSACSFTTTSNFTVLSYAGSCAGVGSNTDLMITELSDPASGNNHYIEIYNGTASTINLDAPDNYALQVVNDPSTTQTVDITGTIAPGQIKVYYAGSNGGLASTPAQGTSNGFNDKDTIKLMKNGLVLDRVNTPNYVGYNYKRLTSVTSPSSTFIPSQWTITPEPTTQSTSGIGTYTVSPTITASSPADVASCSISFTTSATPAGGSTYQWKYNDGNTSTGWTNAVNGTVSGTTISGATTNTISITGDLTMYNGYQFYAEVLNSGCTASSNAAQFTLNAERYYKTAGSGNWSSASTWLMATSPSGPWSTSCTYPTSTSSDYISIENGATVTLDVTPITIDQLIVQTGGFLIHPAGTSLTIGNGASGSDFIINGTYTDNSLTSTVFNSGATWSMGFGGTLIKTNNSAAGIWQTNYEGGISTIPSTANWIIRYNGTNSNIPFISIGSYYPNLTFESTSGSWTPGALTKFTGSTGYSTVKGTLDIGGTGTGTVSALINDNTNSTPLQVLGNVIVRSGSTLTNAGVADGTGFEIKGDVTVDGTFNVRSNSTGLLKLTGISDQNISGTGTLALQDMTINNSGTATVLINRQIPVYGTLTFASGSKLSLASGDVVMKSVASGTSRIAAIPSGVSINYGSGKFVGERYIPTGSHPKSWQFLSVPLNTTQTINEAWQDTATSPNQSRYSGYGTQITSNISPLPSMFDVYTPAGSTMKVFNSATNGWDGVPNTTSTTITNQKGYMVFVRGDRTVVSYNQAAVPTTLRASGAIYTPSSNPPLTTVTAGNFESVGNPYLSAVDFTQIGRLGGIDAAFYVWDPLLTGVWGLGGFQTISSANGYKPVPGGTANYNSSIAYTKIESGQAFLVHATSSTGALSFSESAKASGSNLVFRNGTSNTESSRIATALYTSGGTIADGNMILFDRRFDDSYDENDALKFIGSGENFGIYNNEKLLAVETRKSIANGDSVLFRMSNLKNNSYQLRIMPGKWSNSVRIFLNDRFTGRKISVAPSDSTVYNFDVVNGNASGAENRFYLTFESKAAYALNTIELSLENDNKLVWKYSGKSAPFLLEQSSDGMNFYPSSRFDAQMREAVVKLVPDKLNYYRVKVLSEPNLISNAVVADLRNSELNIFPNPVTTGMLQFSFLGEPGKYVFHIQNEKGENVMTADLQHNSDSDKHRINVSTLVKGMYILEINGAKGVHLRKLFFNAL